MPKLRTLKPRIATTGRQLQTVAPGSWRGDKRSANDRGYTYRWQKARAAWLREHPLCGDRLPGASAEHSACVRDGRPVEAMVVDHIVSHRGDAKLFWDKNNWQSLCKHCHDSFKRVRELAPA